MVNDLLDALNAPEEKKAEAPPTFADPAASAGGAVPVDIENVERVRASGRGGARPGSGRKPKDPNAPRAAKKSAVIETPEVPQISPEVMRALKVQLAESYQVALSLLAFAPVVFSPEERPAVEEGLFYCIETYMPQGMSKHVPAFLLVAVSLAAINRARTEKKMKDTKEK